jgi:hypothetical protein
MDALRLKAGGRVRKRAFAVKKICVQVTWRDVRERCGEHAVVHPSE